MTEELREALECAKKLRNGMVIVPVKEVDTALLALETAYRAVVAERDAMKAHVESSDWNVRRLISCERELEKQVNAWFEMKVRAEAAEKERDEFAVLGARGCELIKKNQARWESAESRAVELKESANAHRDAQIAAEKRVAEQLDLIQTLGAKLNATKGREEELAGKLEIETMAHAEAVKAHLFYMERSKQFEARLTESESALAGVRMVLTVIRDKWVPALRSDSNEGDKVLCHALSIFGVIVRVLPAAPVQAEPRHPANQMVHDLIVHLTKRLLAADAEWPNNGGVRFAVLAHAASEAVKEWREGPMDAMNQAVAVIKAKAEQKGETK